MPRIGQLVQQGFTDNRREANTSLGITDDFMLNRREAIQPNVKTEIVQTDQAILDASIGANKLSIVNVGNAGMSNIGIQSTDIRIWAGDTF